MHEIIEGRTSKSDEKNSNVYAIWQMMMTTLFVTLKGAAEDRQGWRHRERMSLPDVGLQQKTVSSPI